MAKPLKRARDTSGQDKPSVNEYLSSTAVRARGKQKIVPIALDRTGPSLPGTFEFLRRVEELSKQVNDLQSVPPEVKELLTLLVSANNYDMCRSSQEHHETRIENRLHEIESSAHHCDALHDKADDAIEAVKDIRDTIRDVHYYGVTKEEYWFLERDITELKERDAKWEECVGSLKNTIEELQAEILDLRSSDKT
jgi:chromosome segregation ATPase